MPSAVVLATKRFQVVFLWKCLSYCICHLPARLQSGSFGANNQLKSTIKSQERGGVFNAKSNEGKQTAIFPWIMMSLPLLRYGCAMLETCRIATEMVAVAEQEAHNFAWKSNLI